jgi:hypothetical protein
VGPFKDNKKKMKAIIASLRTWSGRALLRRPWEESKPGIGEHANLFGHQEWAANQHHICGHKMGEVVG